MKMWHIEKVILDKEGFGKLTAMEMTGFEPFAVSQGGVTEFPVMYFKRERPDDTAFVEKKKVETVAQEGVPVIVKTTVETAVAETAEERAAKVQAAIAAQVDAPATPEATAPAGKKPKKPKKVEAATLQVEQKPDDGSLADIEAMIAAGKAAA